MIAVETRYCVGPNHVRLFNSRRRAQEYVRGCVEKDALQNDDHNNCHPVVDGDSNAIIRPATEMEEFEFQKLEQPILANLDAASQGASSGPGFFPGADRLLALKVYAGVVQHPKHQGTGQDNQTQRIIRRFSALCNSDCILPEQVAEYLRIRDPLYGV